LLLLLEHNNTRKLVVYSILFKKFGLHHSNLL